MHGNRDAFMSRARLFVDNMLVYGFGGMIAKLVPFLMLPVVTRLLPDTGYFGLSDLSNTIVSLASSFAIMGMYDAMFRVFFDDEDDARRKEVCSTALFFVTGSSLIIAICMLVLQDPISRIFFGSTEYSILVVVTAASTFVNGNNSIAQAPTRMQNKRITFIIMNLVTAILSYSISIPMILLGEYLLALPLAAMLASFSSLVVFTILNRRWFSIRSFNFSYLKTMLVLGLPLMPGFIFYWALHSVDRLLIVDMLGTGEAGIYAAAAKIGQISQLIYTGFAQGWQYFAFSTMKDADQVSLNSRVYEYLGVISLLATALLIVIIFPLFSLVFPESYATGAISTPYLFLAPLLLMLFQVAVNQLLVIKKTWPSVLFLLGGTVVTISVSWLLIPLIGIEGAAIGTLSGYLVSNIICFIVLQRMKLLLYSKRFLLVCLLFAGLFLLWRLVFLDSFIATIFAAGLFVALCIVLYRTDIAGFMRRLSKAHNKN